MTRIPFFIAIVASFTVALQPYRSLKEIEDILKTLATQTAAQKPARSFKYHNQYSGLGLKQRNQNREENNRNYDSEESQEFYYQLNTIRSLKELEDDLQEVLPFVRYRKCKGKGKCDCPWGACGRQGKTAQETVDELEEFLRVLDKDMNKQHNRNFETDEGKRQTDMKSNEFRNRGVRFVDIRDSSMKNVVQERRKQYEEKKQIDRRVGNLNLEDFVAYYNTIKKELTNGLLKYIKGSDDDSYLVPLFPYQKKEIEKLKNVQAKRPAADDELKAKIVALLFGSLSNIKILPHSNDSQTVYIPQQVMDAIPVVMRQSGMRSRLFPLTFYQKQRQRSRAYRNIINFKSLLEKK